MGRHSRNPSYAHRIQRVGGQFYRIEWTVDFYYPSSRLRHPRTFTRETDESGAKRFAKRWNLELPK